MAEFALGQCAMVQNGNWAWGQISDVEGNTVKEEDVKFMPIYTGIAGEENQGLCTGTENFWCVNSQASEADQKATLDFVNWMISSGYLCIHSKPERLQGVSAISSLRREEGMWKRIHPGCPNRLSLLSYLPLLLSI